MMGIPITVVEVVDDLGDVWRLTPTCRYTRNEDAMWWGVIDGCVLTYEMIPLPVFTEWFEQTGFCYCEIGAGGKPCLTREMCDERRKR